MVIADAFTAADGVAVRLEAREHASSEENVMKSIPTAATANTETTITRRLFSWYPSL